MKLMIAIICDTLVADIVDALSKKGYSWRELASTGGFLKKGSSVLLIHGEAEEKENIIDLLRSTVDAHPRKSQDIKKADINLFVLNMNAVQRV